MKLKDQAHRRVVVPVLLLLAASASSGCISVVAYEPNTTLIDARGFQEVHRTTSEVLNRALNPHVTVVDITEAYLQYGWNETFLGPFYNTLTASHENRIYFANIARVELYENHNVYIWGPQDQRVDKILFSNAEDARLFLDCLMSLRAKPRPAA